MEELWIQYYKMDNRFPRASRDAKGATTTFNKPPNRLLLRLYDYADDGEDEKETVADEYAKYLGEARIKPLPQAKFDVVAWWMESAQQIRFPRLAKMAIDLLGAPAQSSDNERLFSLGKFTITDVRTTLGVDVVEASLCLKSWSLIS